MQTFSQTFAGATTWKLEIVGRYFITLATTLGVNVRFYNQGKQLDLGQISGLLAGLEVGGQGLPFEFTRVEIDVLGADTVTVGIGNGVARYNRSQGNVTVNSGTVTLNGATVNGKFNALATTVNSITLGASASRKKVIVTASKSNTDAVGIAFGNTAFAAGNPAFLAPGETWIETDGAPMNMQVVAISGTQSIDYWTYS